MKAVMLAKMFLTSAIENTISVAIIAALEGKLGSQVRSTTITNVQVIWTFKLMFPPIFISLYCIKFMT